MVLVLCIGDTHIPTRAVDLPPQFRKMLVPGKIHHILCTGNLNTRETYDWLKSICGNVHMVNGDCDDGRAHPDDAVLTIGDLKVGLIHGHQIVPWGHAEALSITQRRLGVDILVSGHTHVLQTEKRGNNLFINPGSATGAYSATTLATPPSFVLMDIDGSRAMLYIYTMKKNDAGVDEVAVDKLEYRKQKTPSLGVTT
mmetsp:Transcript_10189/g.30676  ORF Transcript_10189/g.30676 Transcript_10189/m.30676 type:complete len:198 (-) Transcript_10189:592-1185(-)|eukprot:CAMPEP_0206140402 /NCGR_PEP_ID=MMETSP1473-20131121/9325_1 /ASSEMBLY_ACC=CAM_ASM_001109 /TAXON_ID=1461547 /ORGANISM="Stichococcus sp, Strain RCC1054" /LENGTH=197 /DNA_ID=CAMNT_0053534539 /DNA_START=157 /DNA_END=750 /DNA_ORIENTATION=+